MPREEIDRTKTYVREAGFFRIRQAKGGRMVGLRVWFGPPPDPDHPGETLDRSSRWLWQVNGGKIYSTDASENVEKEDGAVWSSREACTKQEYEFLLAAVAHDAKHGIGADPKKAVDFTKLRFDHLPSTGEKK